MAAPIDAASGLPFNGESFPIILNQPFVSLQGTSALDTVFDARGTATAILRIDGSLSTTRSHASQFVDGIHFRNARADGSLGAGAGIWVRGVTGDCFQRFSDAHITNCFFSDNDVGLAIDSNAFVRTETPVCVVWADHALRVFNNTFAWNSIGVWQGNLGGIFNHDLMFPRSVFANNVFDAAPPPGFPAFLSCFEGVKTAQREVSLRGSVNLIHPVTGLGQDFNAFPDTRTDPSGPASPFFNNGASVFLFNSARTPLPELQQALARVDLAPLIPAAGSGLVRTLFVADALRNGGSGVTSDHDLRLCPSVGLPSLTGVPDPLLRNPCVNMGIDAGSSVSLDIVFRVNTALCSGTLGLPSFSPPPSAACNLPVSPPDVDEAPISGWDFDGEGFGNPRIATPPGFAQGTVRVGNDDIVIGDIDIGADELDELILAGFVNGTRLFTVVETAPAGAQDHTRLFFFGLVGTSMPRPNANSILGRLFPWYQHVQDGPGSVPTDRVLGNFTDGASFLAPGGLPNVRTQQLLFLPYPSRTPFPRNLECDFSASLVSDFHPLWGFLFSKMMDPAVVVPDGYASNPWFATMDATSSPPKGLWNPLPFPAPSATIDFLSDNQCLYHNRNLGSLHKTSWSVGSPALLPAETFVLSGHINPPGTFPVGLGGFGWLVASYGIAPFGPFGNCSGATLSFGAFGFNDTPIGCPDSIPQFPGEMLLGRRFNLEQAVAADGGLNLQTYLQVFPSVLPPVGGIGGDGEMMRTGGSSAQEMRARTPRSERRRR
ncbi:MAG: hypothetical protein AB7T19_20225 [Planctomycetota bacterium]